MKKIIRGIFLGLLSVVVIAVSAICVYLFAPEKPTEIVRPTVTDADGNVYLQAVGEAGETYAVVTDADGNIWAAEFKDGKIGSTLASLNDRFTLEEIPKNYSGPKVDETVDHNSFTGNVDVVTTIQAETTTAPSVSPNVEQTTKEPAQQVTTAPQKEEKPFRMKKYQEIFSSNTYIMEFTTNDTELGQTPIVCAAKGGNVLVETTIEGISCKILYTANNDTTYLILDTYKKYCKVPESLMGEDMDMSELNMGANFTSDVTADEVEYSTVTISGKTLNCESYTNEEGKELLYYFDGDTLVRLDCVNNDGSVSSTYISRITSNVPDSTFEIPDGYGYLNLSWLGLVAGE